MVWPVTDKKELCEKKSFNSVAIWLLPKKHSSVISLKTCYGYFRQLLSYFATLFCPTNKDSFQEERFKPIGFMIWVKKSQNEKHIRLRYLIPNFEQLLFWALVWPRSKWKWDFFLSVKKFQSSGVPIGLLTTKKSFSHIPENITESAHTSFEGFLMTT